jgi:tRNA(adenine34) deaminase
LLSLIRPSGPQGSASSNKSRWQPMNKQNFEVCDAAFMNRCIELAHVGSSKGEYPFAAVISRRGQFVCEAHNMVRCERDVTRHAEIIALSKAQLQLKSSNLEDCTLYSTIEPCAMCSYAIRETRIGRVVSSLRSPLMGGYSRWDILSDRNLSSAVPELFASPPEIRLGVLREEVRSAFRKWRPLVWRVIEIRKIFVAGLEQPDSVSAKKIKHDASYRLASRTRSRILDRLWR